MTKITVCSRSVKVEGNLAEFVALVHGAGDQEHVLGVAVGEQVGKFDVAL